MVADLRVVSVWRDSKIGAIYEGTSNIQLQTIGMISVFLARFLSELTNSGLAKFIAKDFE
jgi:hypothetical protein